MDTHVLVDGLLGRLDVDRRVVDAIEDRCASIVVTQKQQGRRGQGELARHAAQAAAGRPIAQWERIRALRAKDKLQLYEEHGEQGELPADKAATFRARGHDDVSDDAHLYGLALAVRGAVITRDENLLRRRRDLAKATGVVTYSPEEVLDDAS